MTEDEFIMNTKGLSKEGMIRFMQQHDIKRGRGEVKYWIENIFTLFEERRVEEARLEAIMPPPIPSPPPLPTPAPLPTPPPMPQHLPAPLAPPLPPRSNCA